MSPYLFVLAMEKFSQIINVAYEAGHWKGVSIVPGGSHLSHIFFFANDLILFSEASTSQANVMKRCVDLFCTLSSQKVNFSKSMVFTSPNVPRDKAKEVASLCGSPITDCLGKYLGVSVIHGRITKFTYTNVFERVQDRLAAWKRKSLSMASRLTLIKAVTASLLVYTMQTAKLPITICNRIDKLNRSFL